MDKLEAAGKKHGAYLGRLFVKLIVRVPLALVITMMIAAAAKISVDLYGGTTHGSWCGATFPVIAYLLWGWMDADQVRQGAPPQATGETKRVDTPRRVDSTKRQATFD